MGAGQIGQPVGCAPHTNHNYVLPMPHVTYPRKTSYILKEEILRVGSRDVYAIWAKFAGQIPDNPYQVRSASRISDRVPGGATRL